MRKLIWSTLSVVFFFLLATPSFASSPPHLVHASHGLNSIHCATSYSVINDPSGGFSPMYDYGDYLPFDPNRFTTFQVDGFSPTVNDQRGVPYVQFITRDSPLDPIRTLTKPTSPAQYLSGNDSEVIWWTRHTQLPHQNGTYTTHVNFAPQPTAVNTQQTMVCVTGFDGILPSEYWFDGITLTDTYGSIYTLTDFTRFRIHDTADPFDFFNPPVVVNDSIDMQIVGSPPFNVNESYQVQITPDVNTFTGTWLCVRGSSTDSNELIGSEFLPQNNTTYTFNTDLYPISATFPVTSTVQDTLCNNPPTLSIQESVDIIITSEEVDDSIFQRTLFTTSIDRTELVEFNLDIDEDFYGNISNIYFDNGLDYPLTATQSVLSPSTFNYQYTDIPEEVFVVNPKVYFDTQFNGQQSIQLWVAVEEQDVLGNSLYDHGGTNIHNDGYSYLFKTTDDNFLVDQDITFTFNISERDDYDFTGLVFNYNSFDQRKFTVTGATTSLIDTFIASGYNDVGFYNPFITASYDYTGSSNSLSGTTLIKNIYLGGASIVTLSPLNIVDTVLPANRLLYVDCPDYVIGVTQYCPYSNIFLTNIIGNSLGHTSVIATVAKYTSINLVNIGFNLTSYALKPWEHARFVTDFARFVNPQNGTYRVEAPFNYTTGNSDLKIDFITDREFTVNRRTSNSTNVDYLIEWIITGLMCIFVLKIIITQFND